MKINTLFYINLGIYLVAIVIIMILSLTRKNEKDKNNEKYRIKNNFIVNIKPKKQQKIGRAHV